MPNAPQFNTRVFSANIRLREFYFLRTLLLHVREATSFEDVRIVNEEVSVAFEEAYRKNIFWQRILNEIGVLQKGK